MVTCQFLKKEKEKEHKGKAKHDPKSLATFSQCLKLNLPVFW